MGITEKKVIDIIKVFNEAIESYNKISLLRKSSQTAIIEEFNSSVQYYSAMETAFSEVIENIISEKCPRNLHEMIEILIDKLSPSPLEMGIDLFYVLRYKDTRNQATHKLDIRELNVYPRLFLNGKKFIQVYIKKNAKILEWSKETEVFDFPYFIQNFRTTLYDNIRVLVLPPVHDMSNEIFEYIFRYHWNIVLDFDPYSAVSGLYNKLKNEKTNLLHLCEIGSYSCNDFSVENMLWIMCDGDKQIGIKSFKPKDKQNGTGVYIPAMLEGKDNWTQCYNVEKSGFDSASTLLKNFFDKYYSNIQYNTEIVFLMDYAKRICESIYSGIKNNLNDFSNTVNVHFINESLNEDLKKDSADYEGWFVHNSSIESFAQKIKANTIQRDEDNSTKIVMPCELPFDGIISHKNYININRNFYLLHMNFPDKGDEAIEISETSQYLIKFSRGEEAPWILIKNKDIAQFATTDSVHKHIKKAIDNSKTFFNLFHVAGFGGSTIAKQVAFDLHLDYPVLFAKNYDPADLSQRISQIYNFTHQRLVIFIDESLFDNIENDRNECIRIAERTSVPVTYIFVGRRPQSFSNKKSEGIFIRQYGKEDVTALINFNKKLLSNDYERKLFGESPENFIENLGEENTCPFLVNLSIYQDEFINVESYISPFIEDINNRAELKKVFVYSCIFSCFSNKGIPLNFASKQLSLTENLIENVRDTFDPLLYIRENKEYYIRELSIRAPYLADCILKFLIGNGEKGIVYREELSKYLKELILDINKIYSNSLYSNKTLRQIFINKSAKGNEYREALEVATNENISVLHKYFSPIIEVLWDKDRISLAGDVFEQLIKVYPEDAYFYAHAARFYAYTGRSFETAKDYYDKAIEKLEVISDGNVSADIYHIKGMCLSKELFRELEVLPKETELKEHIDFTRIREISREAQGTFLITRNIAIGVNSKNLEYACTAWLSLITNLLIKSRFYSILSNEELSDHVERALDLISELEEIFVLNSKENGEKVAALINDLMRKKETIYTYQKDFSTSLSEWNNFYDKNKNTKNYGNCVYACKNRFYLIEKETKNFINISSENKDRIKRLSEDYYESLVQLKLENIKMGDLQVYLSVAELAEVRIDTVMSLVNNFYLQKSVYIDPRLLFYRYMLKFLQAYKGDKLSLKECVSYLSECKRYCEKIPGKANALEYYHIGNEMGLLVSKRMLYKSNLELWHQLYKVKDLQYMKGILRQRGEETYIIPYDINGDLMLGIDVHANLKHNSYIEKTSNGYKVKFRVGFSYDGLKAENMSIQYLESQERSDSDMPNVTVGEYVAFNFTRSLSYDSGKKYALVGKVGKNENCILHISKISKNRISGTDFNKLEEYCNKYPLKVQIIEYTEKGWSASLKSQRINFDKLDSLKMDLDGE